MSVGFKFVVFLIVAGVVAAWITRELSMSRWHGSGGSRVKSDMRSVATGLESYFIDNKMYPHGDPLPARAAALRLKVPQGGRNLLTIPRALSTPVAYLTSLFPDPLVESRGLPFAYYEDGGGWLLISAGPDGDYDITEPSTLYDSRVAQPSALLCGGPWTYDPTNGVESSGDVWRTKQ